MKINIVLTAITSKGGGEGKEKTFQKVSMEVRR